LAAYYTELGNIRYLQKCRNGALAPLALSRNSEQYMDHGNHTHEVQCILKETAHRLGCRLPSSSLSSRKISYQLIKMPSCLLYYRWQMSCWKQWCSKAVCQYIKSSPEVPQKHPSWFGLLQDRFRDQNRTWEKRWTYITPHRCPVTDISMPKYGIDQLVETSKWRPQYVETSSRISGFYMPWQWNKDKK